MKTYTVIYAEDVPHYAQGEIEARGPKDAIAKARKIDTDTFTAYDPDYTNAVSRRIVSIEGPDGTIVAEDIALDGKAANPPAEPTNPERADRAKQLLVTYAIREMRMDELLSADTAETLLTDILADFMHFAAQKNMGFQNCCDLAEMHFDAETNEQGDAP